MPRIKGTNEYSASYSFCFDCGQKRPRSLNGIGRCAECAAKLADQFTVYDRDKGLGSLPPNLRGKS
jgi:hypothetical protein